MKCITIDKMDFREPTEFQGKQIVAHNIEPNDPQKRLRVLGGWLLEDVVEDMKLFNYEFHVMTFLKQCSRLEESFPIHKKHIDDIRLDFWAKAQAKFKILKKEQELLVKMQNKIQKLNDLNRMRF